MSDQQDFEALLPKLKAMDKKALRKQDMPMEQAVNEGAIMATAASQDADALKAVGLDGSVITELGASVNALRYAQGQYVAAIGELKDASKQWATEEPQAYALRDDLLSAMSFGLRKVPDAVKAVRRIREGSGGADMIQDLSALAQLGKKYPGELKTINFDAGLLDQATEKAGNLGQLYAKAFVEKGTADAKDLRDRAFSYMRAVMSEVLDAAEYAFRKDKTKLDYYYSTYRSRQSSSSAKPEPAPAAAAQTSATAK